MKYEVEIGGDRRTVEIKSAKNGSVVATVDGRELHCEISQPEPNVYLLVADNPDGDVFEVRIDSSSNESSTLRLMGTTVSAKVIDPKHRSHSADHGAAGRQQIVSPMPGKVVRIMVAAGDEVKHGQGIIVVEAMKMQNELKSPKDGHVMEISVTEGQTVAAAQALITIE